MSADKVMPHSTVGQSPSGEYVVLAEGDPIPDWFTLDSDDKPETPGTRRRTSKSE